MSGAPKGPPPAPLDLQLQLIAVEQGTPPIHLVVTTPGEVRRLGLRPEEVAQFQAAILALPEFVRWRGLPPDTPRDAAGRFGFEVLRLRSGISLFGIVDDDPRPTPAAAPPEPRHVLWLHPNELDVFAAALDRCVASARRNGMLPEVAG